MVTALGQRAGLPCAFVRKAAKTYGTRRLSEGEVRGRRVLVIECPVTGISARLGGSELGGPFQVAERGPGLSSKLARRCFPGLVLPFIPARRLVAVPVTAMARGG